MKSKQTYIQNEKDKYSETALIFYLFN